MTRRVSSPVYALVLLFISLAIVPAASAAGKKTPPKKSPASKATARKSAREVRRGREKASKREVARQNSRRDARAAKNERGRGGRQASNRRADRGRERASKNDRRAGRNDKRARREQARDLSRKDLRRMSRRERAAALREQARRRREAEERARQAAIARALYLARIRAQDQAWRDETQANVHRDETTGEDQEVRRVAVEALGNHAGSVVVMDPKSGRVYTVVNQEWGLRRGFKPCSTVKLVTGLAGLSDNVIDPVQTVNISTGTLSIDLTEALAYSNNYYFQRVGGQVGFDRMMSYARELGLGQPTGINHPSESAGRLPLVKEGFALNRMSSHGDDIEVTPIQLANMASAIANGGERLVPHLPRTPEEATRFKREVRAKVNVPQDYMRRMLPGMIGAVNYGSGRTAYDPAQTIAGKTGTCISQDSARSWLGLFTSFAPVHNPRLAVAVVTRGSGERGKIAAGIAGKVYRNLSHRFGPRAGDQPLLADEMLIPRPKVDPSKAAALNDEEAEAEAEADAEAHTQGTDAYVVKEAGKVGVREVFEGPQTNVKRTAKIYEKPSNAGVPAAVPTLTATPAPAKPAPGFSRPRRVSDEQPQQQQQ